MPKAKSPRSRPPLLTEAQLTTLRPLLAEAARTLADHWDALNAIEDELRPVYPWFVIEQEDVDGLASECRADNGNLCPASRRTLNFILRSVFQEAYKRAKARARHTKRA